MVENTLPEVCGHRGLLSRHRTRGAAGELSAEGAASLVADAVHAFLVLHQGEAQNRAAALPAITSIALRREDHAALRAGELVSAAVRAASGAGGPAALAVRLHGMHGTAWQAQVSLAAQGCEEGTAQGSEKAGALSMATPPDRTVEGLPPMRLLRTLRPSDCDQAGHVNVQVFMDLADESARALLLSVREEGVAVETVRVRITFRKELFDGDVVTVHTGVLRQDAHGVDLVHGIVHQPSGLVACVVETRMAQVDVAGVPHASPRLPPGESIGDWPALPLARAAAQPRAGAQPVPAAVTTVMSVVDAWDADADGRLTPRALVNLCSTGARQYLATLGLTGARFLAEKITVAAVDYLIELNRRPPLGSNLTVRSALLSASAKSIRFSHHLLDSDDGTVYASIEIVGVMLDLAAHRSMEIPQDVKQRLGLA